jgi:hypothetical protein
MFLTLWVVLLVLDNLEEDENENEPDDAEKVAADALRTVLVNIINQYNQFKRGWINENGAPVPKKHWVALRFNWRHAGECILQNMSIFPTKK